MLKKLLVLSLCAASAMLVACSMNPPCACHHDCKDEAGHHDVVEHSYKGEY